MNATGFSGRRYSWLTWVAAACASVSGAALLAHAAGWLPLYFLVDISAAPSLAGLLAVGAIARQINERIFYSRLVSGLWMGIVATLAYDATRWLLWRGGVIEFDPFISHPIFGMLITGLPEISTTALLVGWLYHFWNGIGFAILYTLVAGPAGWGYAVLWALFLEAAWLTALPSILSFNLNSQLIALSVIGHLAYGATLGGLAQRYILEAEFG
jgi:hypothetical protein